MKKIQFDSVYPPNKNSLYKRHHLYGVFLGNGVHLEFISRKKADAFVAESNRFITTKLMECNSDYSDLYYEYRRCWIYFAGRTEKSSVAYRNMEISIRAKLQNIAEALDYVTKPYLGDNLQMFVWKKMTQICTDIDAAAKLLIAFKKKRGEVYERIILENLRKKALHRQEEILNFGADRSPNEKPSKPHQY